VESFAFLHEVAYGTTTTCARVVCGQRVHRRSLRHHWIEPFLGHGIAAEMAESVLDKMTGLIRLEEVQCYGLFAARERHRSEGIGNSGTDSGGRPSGGRSAATRLPH
jgi:hypothetical protein